MANLLESASRNKARKNGKERKLKNIYFRSVINMLSLNFPSYILREHGNYFLLKRCHYILIKTQRTKDI